MFEPSASYEKTRDSDVVGIRVCTAVIQRTAKMSIPTPAMNAKGTTTRIGGWSPITNMKTDGKRIAIMADRIG
jgi:hypothetical protein